MSLSAIAQSVSCHCLLQEFHSILRVILALFQFRLSLQMLATPLYNTTEWILTMVVSTMNIVLLLLPVWQPAVLSGVSIQHNVRNARKKVRNKRYKRNERRKKKIATKVVVATIKNARI